MNVTIAVLGILIATTFVVVWLWDLVWERDVATAAQKTGRRVGGVALGAGSVAGAGATVGFDLIAQLPELAITILGIGAIVTGISWEVFGATAFLTWLVAEAVNGRA